MFFSRSMKQRKTGVFYCFVPHFFYIIKQMKKPKPCITCDKTLCTFDNTRAMSLVFSNARRVLSQCNRTWLWIFHLLRKAREKKNTQPLAFLIHRKTQTPFDMHKWRDHGGTTFAVSLQVWNRVFRFQYSDTAGV